MAGPAPGRAGVRFGTGGNRSVRARPGTRRGRTDYASRRPVRRTTPGESSRRGAAFATAAAPSCGTVVLPGSWPRLRRSVGLSARPSLRPEALAGAQPVTPVTDGGRPLPNLKSIPLERGKNKTPPPGRNSWVNSGPGPRLGPQVFTLSPGSRILFLTIPARCRITAWLRNFPRLPNVQILSIRYEHCMCYLDTQTSRAFSKTFSTDTATGNGPPQRAVWFLYKYRTPAPSYTICGCHLLWSKGPGLRT